MQRYHVLVSGLVQGVGFRYFVWQAARRFGLSGWVRNLDSGEVELEAQGPSDKLKPFLAEIRKGPRFSQVNDVHLQEIELQSAHAFEIQN